jgi:hypothetical protein
MHYNSWKLLAANPKSKLLFCVPVDSLNYLRAGLVILFVCECVNVGSQTGRGRCIDPCDMMIDTNLYVYQQQYRVQSS